MTYRHGVYISEVPTSLVPPVAAAAGLPVVFGTAPVNLAADGVGKVNEPVLCYTYAEAVQALGYSTDWTKYTLCEFMKSHFALFAVAPVVLVNVLDPAVHKNDVTSETLTLTAGVGTLASTGIKKSTVVIKSSDGNTPYALNTDYTLAFDDDGKLVLTVKSGGTIPSNATALKAAYTKLDPSAVDKDDIIGGIDGTSGAREGLELVNEIFPRFRLVPGQILAPGWSHEPTVAAVMDAKANNINGHFRCISLVDIPTGTVKLYSDVAAWKTNNNYTSDQQIVCWPKVKLDDEIYHLSTQLAGVICRADAVNDDVPYVSPSNRSLQANGAVLADGTEVILGPDQAAYLNGQGVITALNFIGGWKAWGNRTGAYPGSSDPKDTFIPIRRMFDWIGNTLVQTFWAKVDYPLNRRLIDTVLDSANIWMNGLAARGFILGGRVAMLSEENPTTDLMNGIVRFHVYATPPGPAREIDFIVEYDPQYLSGLLE